jgi:hypothetical protein
MGATVCSGGSYHVPACGGSCGEMEQPRCIECGLFMSWAGSACKRCGWPEARAAAEKER